MKTKNDTKIEEELSCRFKVDEGFDKLWPEHSKVSKICVLMGSLSPNYIMFELKK